MNFDDILITSFVVIPLVSFIFIHFFNEKDEKNISKLALYSIGITFFIKLIFFGKWFYDGMSVINLKELELYKSKDYVFLIDFFFDNVTATFLFVGGFISFLIVRYSSYYMHLEKGYKRFFATTLFFYFSYNFTLLSGNFETIFMGWEMLGLSSFLLIAFYRERYLPVHNAIRVFGIYRIGDVGLFLAMWASHHLWHENITFLKLSNYDLVHEQLVGHNLIGLFIALCILVAAAAKSAQMPFSSWIPRAMEGPTPSSAVFYGSLSVHLGVFLLIRTMPFWEQQPIARFAIGFMGITTALIGFFVARVQSTIKTQIAYASISQIGLMFLEISLGLEYLALIHFVGNAFLRTYQLLVSPSVVSYLIREQFYYYIPQKRMKRSIFSKGFDYTLYVMALKEFNMDTWMNRFVFRPFKRTGEKLNFLTIKNVFFYFIPMYVIGAFLLFNSTLIPEWFHKALSDLFALIALLGILKAFSERKSPMLAWTLMVMSHFWIALGVMHNENFDIKEVAWYLSGAIFTGIIGWLCLAYLAKKEPEYFSLKQYFGHVYEYPKLSNLFLFTCLGLMGFPVTTSFIGEDLIFSHIHEDQWLLAFLNASSFVIGGIALIRIYTRLFLGNHVKNYHETPLLFS